MRELQLFINDKKAVIFIDVVLLFECDCKADFRRNMHDFLNNLFQSVEESSFSVIVFSSDNRLQKVYESGSTYFKSDQGGIIQESNLIAYLPYNRKLTSTVASLESVKGLSLDSVSRHLLSCDQEIINYFKEKGAKIHPVIKPGSLIDLNHDKLHAFFQKELEPENQVKKFHVVLDIDDTVLLYNQSDEKGCVCLNPEILSYMFDIISLVQDKDYCIELSYSFLTARRSEPVGDDWCLRSSEVARVFAEALEEKSSAAWKFVEVIAIGDSYSQQKTYTPHKYEVLSEMAAYLNKDFFIHFIDDNKLEVKAARDKVSGKNFLVTEVSRKASIPIATDAMLNPTGFFSAQPTSGGGYLSPQNPDFGRPFILKY